MIIGIDGNEANVLKKVGIGEYAFQLLVQFEKIRNQNLEFIIYLKTSPNEDLPKERDGWKYRIVKPQKLWTQVGLPIDLFLNKPRPDVFFTPTHYAPRFSPVKTAVSIMDLSYIHFPQMFKKSDLYQLKNWSNYSVKKATKVFTISKASKDDIIKTYQVFDSKVVVTYPGIKMETSKQNQSTGEFNSKLLKDKYDIEGDYILFVGTLQPRKNIERLIEAFSKISDKASKNLTPKLVIIGKRGWLYEQILNAPKKFNVEENVKFLEFVPSDDLPVFYKNATCFVLPSLYEGFGLPVVEAMSFGCPVITSNISSLPEAGGEAALYIDPNNTDDITSKIELVLADKKLREEMVKKGYEQVKKFSWEKTAKETLQVLEEIGNSR